MFCVWAIVSTYQGSVMLELENRKGLTSLFFCLCRFCHPHRDRNSHGHQHGGNAGGKADAKACHVDGIEVWRRLRHVSPRLRPGNWRTDLARLVESVQKVEESVLIDTAIHKRRGVCSHPSPTFVFWSSLWDDDWAL